MNNIEGRLYRNIEFINTGEFKDVDYYLRKYGLGIKEEFDEFWESKVFFNGKKIGISKVRYNEEENKLNIYYFRTDYKTAQLVRNFLYKLEDKGELKLESEDMRCNLGFEVFLKDKQYGLFTKRKYDWYGNIKDKIYQLTASEGFVEEDIKLMNESVDKVALRSLKEELGVLEIDYITRRIGYAEGRNTVLYVEYTVNDLSKVKVNLKGSEDSKQGIEDIDDIYKIPLRDMIYNKEYMLTLNTYLLKNVKWVEEIRKTN